MFHFLANVLLSYEIIILTIVFIGLVRSEIKVPVYNEFIQGSAKTGARSGEIKSPGYPVPYSSSEEIFMFSLQNTDRQGTVTLTFHFLHLGPFSSLKIYDGDTSAYPLMVLTGREKTQIKSQSQNLLLVFKTGRQNHGNPGFNATYQFIQGGKTNTSFSKVAESSCLAAVMTHRCRSSSKCYSDVDLCDGFDDCGGTNSTDEATCDCTSFEAHPESDALIDHVLNREPQWPNSFYLGKGSFKRCSEACLRQPKCMVFTVYNKRYKNVKLRGRCYGAAEIPSWKWKRKVPHTVTGTRTCNNVTKSTLWPPLIGVLVGLHLVLVPLILICWNKKRRQYFFEMMGRFGQCATRPCHTRNHVVLTQDDVLRQRQPRPQQRGRTRRPGRAYRSGSRSPSPRNHVQTDNADEINLPRDTVDLESLFPTPPAPPESPWPGMPEWARSYRHRSGPHPIEVMYPDEPVSTDPSTDHAGQNVEQRFPPSQEIEGNVPNLSPRVQETLEPDLRLPSIIVTPPHIQRSDSMIYSYRDQIDNESPLVSSPETDGGSPPVSFLNVPRNPGARSWSLPDIPPPTYGSFQAPDSALPSYESYQAPDSELPSYDTATRLLHVPGRQPPASRRLPVTAAHLPVPPPAYEDV